MSNNMDLYQNVSQNPNMLIAHSCVYHPTISNMDDYQNSNRGIFPPSVFNLLDNNINNNNLPGQPIIVRISNDTMVKDIYVTAHEFSATEGTMYLSSDLMNDHFLNEGDGVTINVVSLPNITKLVLRPRCPRFAREISDPKLSLETAIISRYQVLSHGDILNIEGFELEISTLEPAEVVITNESDPEVEFLPCREDERKMKIEKDKRDTVERLKKAALDEERLKKEKLEQDKIMEETYKNTGHRFVPFGGEGHSLNDKKVGHHLDIDNIDNKDNKKQASIKDHRSTNKSARHLRDYSRFSGTGHKLDSK